MATVGECLVRALILVGLCGMCGSIFFLPLALSLRRSHLRAAGRPERPQLAAIVVINALIGVCLISSLWLVYVDA